MEYLNFVIQNPNEIFLDAGAFVGDTIEKFIYNTCATFKKIYGFEPGEKQFKAMKLRMNRLIEEWSINNENIILEKLDFQIILVIHTLKHLVL
ncbi:hypothetical protein OFS07_15080 [Brachyspira hyodysenteriae]|nr:hypothetical protein [Brachyspira hyodysenteriae]MDA0067581.1 hypothetical protein [Brachyspira hyodysenteriae]MDA0073380.1 hypothetical protein [Brachyspira hyodysenteriae]MDA0073427.1 hypothetical protein [Brachyspira hyodysenteriae]MDA0090508.1 hypothetical protein [Brachyspira hyodysenteriae]